MFDMSQIEYDKGEDMADTWGKMINKMTMSAIGSAAQKAQTLTLWDVVKLILMIIQMKLLYVTFQAQYYMAVMAAQAPLMMANPMSMFGFNPMN